MKPNGEDQAAAMEPIAPEVYRKDFMRKHGPNHQLRNLWHYTEGLTSHQVSELLSDLKPRQARRAKVIFAGSQRYVVWWPAL